MERERIFGFHSVFYYYGKTHMLVNMCNYIKTGIAQNEVVYLYLENDFYESIMKNLEVHEKEHIHMLSGSELILLHSEGGREVLENRLSLTTYKAMRNGYCGVRFIEQPSIAIAQTSKEKFLDFEEDITEAIKDLNISFMCIYDFHDFIKKKKYIDDRVIKQSRETHTHHMFNMELQSIV